MLLDAPPGSIVKRALKIFALLLVLVPLGLAAYVWYLLQPHPQDLPLPDTLVSVAAPEGIALLQLADRF